MVEAIPMVTVLACFMSTRHWVQPFWNMKPQLKKKMPPSASPEANLVCVFLIDDGSGEWQTVVSVTTSGLIILGAAEKQTKQVKGSKPGSSTRSWPPHQSANRCHPDIRGDGLQMNPLSPSCFGQGLYYNNRNHNQEGY